MTFDEYQSLAIKTNLSKEDKLQEWMERCWFGSDMAFSDLEAELKAFEIATKPEDERRQRSNDRANDAYAYDAALQAG